MILLTGGTGFVGSSVAHALRAQERTVRCLVRNPTKAGRLRAWSCEVVAGDVADAASVRAAVSGCDTVVHLVSIIVGRPADFARVMVEGTSDLVSVATEAGVRRFVLMSALGVNESTKDLTPYFGAKWAMEEDVRSSRLEHVIFRPSFIFGRDGGVLPTFVRQVRWSPLTPVVGDGQRRLQPIWVEDVAAHFAAAVDSASATNRTFELGGPDPVTWNELYERIAQTLGTRRRRLHLPVGLVRTGATIAELLPRPPITRGQLTMLLARDSVCDTTAALEVFGISLLPLDEQLRRAV